jgi:2Fe-2S ferredoxin
MITIHLFPADAPEGPAIELAGKPGQSLMQAAVAANVDGIQADCGGLMTCATCHVYVREPHADHLPLPLEDEESMLDFTASARKPNSRLSCQIQLTQELDGLAVDLPPSQH